MCTAHSGIALLTTYSRESGVGITSSKGASKSSKDDDDKTSTEIVTEAISKGLKQDRTLRAKAIASKQSTLWWLHGIIRNEVWFTKRCGARLGRADCDVFRVSSP